MRSVTVRSMPFSASAHPAPASSRACAVFQRGRGERWRAASMPATSDAASCPAAHPATAAATPSPSACSTATVIAKTPTLASASTQSDSRRWLVRNQARSARPVVATSPAAPIHTGAGPRSGSARRPIAIRTAAATRAHANRAARAPCTSAGAWSSRRCASSRTRTGSWPSSAASWKIASNAMSAA